MLQLSGDPLQGRLLASPTDQAEKACLGQTLQLIMNTVQLATESQVSFNSQNFRCSPLGQALASPTNITLGWKGLPGTNALAYYEKSELTSVKSFTTLAPCKLEKVLGTMLQNLIAQSNVQGLDQEPTLEWSTSGRLQPYTQSLDQAGGMPLKNISLFINYGCKKMFCKIMGPGDSHESTQVTAILTF